MTRARTLLRSFSGFRMTTVRPETHSMCNLPSRFRFHAILASVALCISASQLAAQPSISSLLKLVQTGSADQQVDAIQSIATMDLKTARPLVVRALITRLQSSDVKVKISAAKVLGKIATGDVETAKALIGIAFDKDPQVRSAVMQALVDLKAPRELAIELWIETMKGNDHEVIMDVIHSMADMGAAVVPGLRQALKNPEAAYWACLVAAEIGPEAGEAATELLELIDHAQPEVQLQAIIAIGNVKGKNDLIAPSLVRVLQGDGSLAAKYAACYALAQYPKTDAGVAALESKLETTQDVELKVLSGWSLLMLAPNSSKRDAALQAMISGLSSDNSRVRQLAVRALTGIQPSASGPSPEVVKAMARALQDSDPQVIAQVMEGLSAKGAASVPTIEIGLDNETIRPFAVELARRLGPVASPAVPKLVSVLNANRSNFDLAREINFALGAIGNNASVAVPALAKGLTSESDQVRYSACYALGNIGPDAAAAIESLKQGLSDEKPFLRIAAAWSLMKIKSDDDALVQQSLPALIEGLQSDNEFVRIEAARTLGQLGPRAASSLAALKKLDSDESSLVRQTAAEAIASIGGR